MFKNIAIINLVVAVSFLTAFSASAQDTFIDPPADDEWRVIVTPYLFLPVTTSGTATIAGASADIDLDLGDTFGALRFAGSLRGELWRGRFGLIADGYYVNLSGGSNLTLPGQAGISGRADVSVKQGWAAGIGAYRFYNGSIGEDRRASADAGVGFRYNILRQKFGAAFDIGPSPGLQTTLGGTETWFEPLFMLRGAMEISDTWSVGAQGEIGGFGAGGSDLQWNVLIGTTYAPWEQVSLKAGWQFYGIDFETERSDGTFAYDVFQTGPYLAASVRF